MNQDTLTLLRMFIDHGNQEGSFEISYFYGVYTLRIGDFIHQYTKQSDLNHQLEETLLNYLKQPKPPVDQL